jgi:hypothetical protein
MCEAPASVMVEDAMSAKLIVGCSRMGGDTPPLHTTNKRSRTKPRNETLIVQKTCCFQNFKPDLQIIFAVVAFHQRCLPCKLLRLFWSILPIWRCSLNINVPRQRNRLQGNFENQKKWVRSPVDNASPHGLSRGSACRCPCGDCCSAG